MKPEKGENEILMKKKKAKKASTPKVEKPVEREQKKPVDIPKRPTIEELEELLSREEDQPIEILPNGEVRAARAREGQPKQKPLTLRENLGGEYAAA